MSPNARFILWNVVVLPTVAGAVLGLFIVTLTCSHRIPSARVGLSPHAQALATLRAYVHSEAR